ncbi:MAG TPA: phosphoribosylformylglycinamidine synthase subunit PurL [Thermoplasmataceae archaeon]|nr:phosphoribosylformylglycinamidine synthase subunit PurL [Thermoplasmataceae archaeon]
MKLEQKNRNNGNYRREVPVTGLSNSSLLELSERMGLGLNIEEMIRLREYFRALDREPTDVELQAMAQAWSEHCCYKSSKFYLRENFSGLEKGPAILAMEDDAGVVEFDDTHAYVIKMESHNHPSAVEPYGGAATGVGGIIRDILCMGGLPIALMDSLYLGEAWARKTKNSLSPRYVMNSIIAGVRDYGNRVGIPNIAGSISFDSCFNSTPLVNAGCLGIVRKDKIVRSRIDRVGDLIILCGGRTGRDGIHGVNFASATLKSGKAVPKSVVQLGNPILKEPLIHAILELNDLGVIHGMKDLGGGGLSSSVGEMCLAGGVTASLELSNVLLKESDMEPWEIWVSESQERMVLSIDEKDLQLLDSVFKKWDIEYSVLGRSEPGTNLKLYYRGEKVFDLDLNFVTSGPIYCRNYQLPEPRRRELILPQEPENLGDFLVRVLSSPHLSSRSPITRQYDHTVRGKTIIRPLTGKPNGETHSDAAVLRPLRNSERGIALTAGSRYDMVAIDPYAGTLGTMMEAFLNILSSGGLPHTVVDCLNLGNPEEPQIMGQLMEITRAISEFCKSFNLPVVSGNVSLYNQYGDSNIKPVPTIVMTGIVTNVSNAITTEFKSPGNRIILIGRIDQNLGGSQILKILEQESSALPWFDLEMLHSIRDVWPGLVEQRLLEAAHDVSDGGLIQTLLEMGFGSDLGFDVDITKAGRFRTFEKLFSEGGPAIVVEVKPENVDQFNRIIGPRVPIIEIGSVTSGEVRVSDFNLVRLDSHISEFKRSWEDGLSRLL